MIAIVGVSGIVGIGEMLQGGRALHRAHGGIVMQVVLRDVDRHVIHVDGKIGHQRPSTRHREAVGGAGRHHRVVFRPVHKVVARGGRGDEGTGGEVIVATDTIYATARRRVGSGGDGIVVDAIDYINSHIAGAHSAGDDGFVGGVARDGRRLDGVRGVVDHRLGMCGGRRVTVNVLVVDGQRVAVDGPLRI